MTPTREFTIDELDELGATYGGDAVISDEVIDTRRWYEIHEVILHLDGKYWGIHYSRGLTEIQEDIKPFDSDPVMATLMEPYEVKVTKYRKVQR